MSPRGADTGAQGDTGRPDGAPQARQAREGNTRMAWESRNGRGRYLTKSVKRDGRVIRQYLGTGPVAEIIAKLEALERERREVERAERREAEARLDEALRLVETFSAEVDTVVGATLERAGFHRPKRGKWRKRRGQGE